MYIYLDGLLHRLSESGVGCFIGHVFTGALANADDVVLLAPTPSAMRVLLNICEFSVAFNAVKSVCMQVSKVSQSSVIDLQFTLGRSLKFVEKCTHLGHIISARLDDKCDIVSRKTLCVAKLTMYWCTLANVILW